MLYHTCFSFITIFLEGVSILQGGQSFLEDWICQSAKLTED